MGLSGGEEEGQGCRKLRNPEGSGVSATEDPGPRLLE